MNLIKYSIKIALSFVLFAAICFSSIASNKEIIDSTIYHVKKKSHFYDSSTYEKIFVASIDAVNTFSEDIFIQILESTKHNLKIKIKNAKVEEELILSKNKNLVDVGRNLNKIINFLEKENILSDKMLSYHVANAVLQEIDEYSSIIEPEELEQFMAETKGSFGGIGIVVTLRDEKLTIISPIDGTPASKAGIKANDIIRRIESIDTAGMSLQKAVTLLRGEKGSSTTLYIERENVEDLIQFDVVRDTIKIDSVSSKILEEKVGYIKIKAFQANSFEDFEKALNSLRDKGIESLILDLRGNPGGLFDQSLKISNIFLKNKLIVSTRGKRANINRDFFTARTEVEKFFGPVIVLVDRGSASAAEIVAGALKNNKRSLVLGEKTFGKGTVQEVYEQEDGSAIKLTIAEYLNPEEYKVHLNGIVPDILFVPVEFEDEKLIFNNDSSFIQFNNENKGLDGLSSGKTSLQILYSKKEDKEKDDELIQFSQFLLNSESLKKVAFNENTENFLSLIEEELEVRVRDLNSSLTSKIENFYLGDIESGKDVRIKNEKVGLDILKTIKLESGKSEEVEATIENNSDKQIRNLVISLNSENRSLDNKFFFVGLLGAGEKKSISMKINIPSWVENSEDLLNFTLSSISLDDPLRPRFLEIQRTSSKAFITKNRFDYPQFSFFVLPKDISEEKIELDLIIELKRITQEREFSQDCSKCQVKVLSKDNDLIIKAKYHKIPDIHKKDALIKTTLSIDIDNIEDDIQFIIRFHDEESHSFFDKIVSLPLREMSSYKKYENVLDYRIQDKNLFFSDPGEDAIITGRIHRGGLIQASGETENFVLINNNDSPAFWIKKLDVVQTNNEEKSKFIDAKIISEYESPPTMEIKTQILEDKNKAKIVSLIKDDTNLKSVNYFINGKKIRLVAEGKRNINETFGIQLEPGRNKLSVMAIDKKNIKVFEDFFITSYEK
tara:strand:+ start:93121 stop:95982 length:2862 start_codon:yes stop_codon:yes gene_type:complete